MLYQSVKYIPDAMTRRRIRTTVTIDDDVPAKKRHRGSNVRIIVILFVVLILILLLFGKTRQVVPYYPFRYQRAALPHRR